MLRGIVFVFIGLTLVLTAAAQPADVGHISQISEDGAHEVPRTQRAQLVRVGGALDAARQDTLFFQDLLHLRQQVYLDLQFTADIQSRAVLSPQTLEQEGFYEILHSEANDISGLQLLVRQGRMVVQHQAGKLEVIAAGIKTDIWGTTVLFDVDESGDTAFIYLKKGVIQFPEHGMMGSGKKRTWRLTRGQAPQEVFLARSELKEWKEVVQHDTRVVWRGGKPPFFKRPGIMIPLTLIAAGGIYCAFKCGGEATKTGTIIITLP